MMADEQPQYNPTSGDLHPELAQTPAAPAVQDWMAGAVSAIQDHVAARSIAENSQAQGAEFVNALADTKQNLVGMAKSDPSSVPLAFDLVDSFPEHMAPFGAHFKEEIAKSAVQGLAAQDRDAAHAAIDRYADYIPEGEQAALRQYADHFETLRGLDANAEQLEFNKNLQRVSNIQAEAHLNQLQEPETGTLRFPAGWGQRVMTDAKLAPDAKAALISTYSNLQRNGDLIASDPHLVTDLLSRAALPPQHGNHPNSLEILSQAGNGLTISDAQYLSSRTGPQSPAARADTQALAGALEDARGMIGNARAWGRFVQWALPAAKQGGLVLDPTSKDYSLAPERMARFMPTGDDIVAPAVRVSDERPSLEEIFARVKQAHVYQTMSNMDPQIDRLPLGPVKDTMHHPGDIGPDAELPGDPVISPQREVFNPGLEGSRFFPEMIGRPGDSKDPRNNQPKDM